MFSDTSNSCRTSMGPAGNRKERNKCCVGLCILKWKSLWRGWGLIRWRQHAFNDVRVTVLCCLAHLSAGCNRAEEWGLMWLEAGLKLPASRTQKRRALLRCGGRWPGFCGCYYRTGEGYTPTHNPAAARLTADTCTLLSTKQHPCFSLPEHAHSRYIPTTDRDSSHVSTDS